jgi:hypothetical protein
MILPYDPLKRSIYLALPKVALALALPVILDDQRTLTLSEWIGSHTRAFAFFRGAPAMTVSNYVPGLISFRNGSSAT